MLVDDEDDWTLADEDDCMAVDEDACPLAVESASFATLEDEVIDVDFRTGAPLVLVVLEDTRAEMDKAVELFGEELMTFDDELFTAEDEA